MNPNKEPAPAGAEPAKPYGMARVRTLPLDHAIYQRGATVVLLPPRLARPTRSVDTDATAPERAPTDPDPTDSQPDDRPTG